MFGTGYGTLTKFDGVDENTARERVRSMKNFGILEFQFYNAGAEYSGPPEGYTFRQEWTQPILQTRVQKHLLQAYVEEIAQVPAGRSWLYVNAMAWDPDRPLEDDFIKHGVHEVMSVSVPESGQPEPVTLLDVIQPNAAVAHYIAPRWGRFARHLGFDGIIWSMMKLPEAPACPGDWIGFLRVAREELAQFGLLQNSEFVDECHWASSMVTSTPPLVSFPVWSKWGQPVWTNWDL
jgi:hypothetical protein